VRHFVKHNGWASAACVLIAGFAASGCGGSSSSSGSSVGVTANSVTIGSHTPLTGPAAPGYSEIDPAAAAYFKYINSQGGVNGRKITLIYKDDMYNPANTVTVVKGLVLQNKVFAIYAGLGTPTHTKVVGYLNAEHVPDLFVASGCPCWDNGTTQPWTFGWQPSYQIEGKILGQYIVQHFAGKKIGVLYQDDDFGQGGLAGLKEEVPASAIVSAQPYEPGTTNLAPQVTAIKSAGAQVLVDFTTPIYTALERLVSFTLGYKAQLVVGNVGIDPTTVGALLKSFSKGKASTALIEGAISDDYLPSPTDTSNSWIALFKKVHDQYDASAPFDGNVVYGMAQAYTFAEALKKAGSSPTRQGIVNAIEAGLPPGPGLVPFRYTKTVHGGYGGVAITTIKNGKIVFLTQPMTTDPSTGPITPYTTPQATAPTNGLP
jgi:branched-chain amino acid transport system substrate-binding protein